MWLKAKQEEKLNKGDASDDEEGDERLRAWTNWFKQASMAAQVSTENIGLEDMIDALELHYLKGAVECFMLGYDVARRYGYHNPTFEQMKPLSIDIDGNLMLRTELQASKW